jgi:hypothetical protein
MISQDMKLGKNRIQIVQPLAIHNVRRTLNMHTRIKPLFVALTAALIFGAAVSASATRLASSSDTFRTAFARLEWVSNFFFTIQCQFTVEGRYHSRTISKVNESLIGYVTSAYFGSCTGGSFAVAGESLPWHVRYRGFTGTLPRIETITQGIIGARFRMGTCELTTSASSPGIYTLNHEFGGIITEVRASGNVVTSGSFCPSSIQLGGTGVPTDQTGARIRITLVA